MVFSLVQKIRPFVLADSDQLIELWKGLQISQVDPLVGEPAHLTTEENVARFREFVTMLHKEDKNQILVAELDGKLIGYTISRKQVDFPLETTYKWAVITDLFIHPEHRRKGIATELLQRNIQYLKSSGVTHVRINVLQNNKVAISLYHKFGFEDHTLTLQKRTSMCT